MNRFISSIVALVLSVVFSGIAGYWNARGVVPLGDARIPAWMVGTLIVGFATFCGVVFGGLVPWKSWVSRIVTGWSNLSSVASDMQAKLDDALAKQEASVSRNEDSPDSIPLKAAHLLECCYHLRVALAGDDDGQELLDQIQIKIGRVSAKVATTKSKGE